MSENNQQKDKVLVKGTAKKIVFKKTGGHLYKLSIKMSQLNKIHKFLNGERVKRGLAETDYMPLELRGKQKEDDWGNTHILFADLWMPPEKTEAKPQEKKEDPFDGAFDEDDEELPF